MHALYTARVDGRIEAMDIASHEIVQTSNDAPLRYRLIMPSSGTMSPDGHLWYLPIKIPNNGDQAIEQILVFDTQAMSIANVITPVGPFWGLALSPDGQRLYASQLDLKNIMVIDTGHPADDSCARSRSKPIHHIRCEGTLIQVRDLSQLPTGMCPYFGEACSDDCSALLRLALRL